MLWGGKVAMTRKNHKKKIVVKNGIPYENK